MNSNLIKSTIAFVKQELSGNESGHDWWHTYRVYRTAESIAEKEHCNKTVVLLGALLHDISDAKLNGGDEKLAGKLAGDFLASQKVDPDIIQEVLYIIEHISFRKNLNKKSELTPELAVVMDADRLDAIGAIGIARTFNYGGFKNRLIHDPDFNQSDADTYDAYTKSEAPTIHHFYDKLLHLKDLMNTKTGKAMAEERHRFMETYLDRFYKEWNGEM
ncbi:HD domain-containing protein [Saccharicrinis sp. FJH62]|uniref:HD domain-containing protein n=1 Tax=Saccharicrinis sp. FJH62 TaxID=3344657 RepID=UPI0035D43C24